MSNPGTPRSVRTPPRTPLSGASAAMRVTELVEAGATAKDAERVLMGQTALAEICLTREEVEAVAAEAWLEVGSAVTCSTLAARGRERMGFHIVDVRETGRVPEVPLRREYEQHHDHGAVRRALRLAPREQHTRFEHTLRMLHTPQRAQRWRAHHRHTPSATLRKPPKTLFYVSLANIPLTAARTLLLAEGVAACPFLGFLSLAGCGIGEGEGFAPLCDVLAQHKSIARLDVSGNRLRASGAETVSRVVRAVALTHLDVSLNGIGDVGVGALCTAVLGCAGSVLCSLNLSCNAIGAKGGWHLSRLVRDHAPLRTLLCWRNNLAVRPRRLAHSGARYLFETVPGSALQELNLAHNSITQEDVSLLLDAFRAHRTQHGHSSTGRCHVVLSGGNSLPQTQLAELAQYCTPIAPAADTALISRLHAAGTFWCEEECG